MNIAILICLIINILIIGMLTLFSILCFTDDKQKAWRKFSIAEYELGEARTELITTKKELETYKKKFPAKTKFKIDDIVFAKHNDFTYNGRIVAVIIKKDETSTNNIIDYMINYQGRTVTVNEVNVYLEKH